MAQDFLIDYCNFSVGGQRALADFVTSIFKDICEELKGHLKECYPSYAIVHDGTPVFAEALAVKVRVVNKNTLEIKEFLIHLGLFKKSLSGKDIKDEIVKALEKFDLELKNWRVGSSDRASPNYTAVTEAEETNGVKVLFNPCIPHGLSNTGKQFVVPHAEAVRKGVNSVTKYKFCKSKNVFEIKFGEKTKRSGLVRFHGDHEHIAQLHRLGLDKVKEFVAECARNKYSEKTSKKLLAKLEDPAFLTTAMVEMAVVSDGGRDLCRLTHVLEGNSVLVLVGNKALAKFEETILKDVDSISLPNLESSAKEASAIVAAELRPFKDAVDRAKETLQIAEAALEKASKDLEAGLSARRGTASRANARSRRGTGARDYRNMANPNAQPSSEVVALRAAQGEAVAKAQE